MSCYFRHWHSENRFDGNRERVLERDGHRCRVCAAPTNVVHHRRPGVDNADDLIAVCRRCHGQIHRYEFIRGAVPALLLELWKEQHPDRPMQLQLVA